jgi:hypothetical protein
MLITRRDGRLLLIDQNEHGRLAGEFARRWGNETFAPPARRDAVALAAAWHDEGWREPDEAPLFNEEEARPLYFLEIERDDHVALYGRGVDRVFERDPYAGLLVSMHWTGLYRGRWGMQSTQVAYAGETALDQLQNEAIEAQERRWIEAKRELLPSVRRSEFEADLWHNYDLIQSWDVLSLFVSMADLRPAPAGSEAMPLVDALYSIDQVPGPRIVESVPLRMGGERADLLLTAVEDGVVVVDPYPFDTDEVEFRLVGRAIADRRYADAQDARAALESADEVTVTCRMIRG